MHIGLSRKHGRLFCPLAARSAQIAGLLPQFLVSFPVTQSVAMRHVEEEPEPGEWCPSPVALDRWARFFRIFSKIFYLRRLWGILGNHLKEFKNLRLPDKPRSKK